MEKNISKYLAFRWMALYMLFCDDDLDRANFALSEKIVELEEKVRRTDGSAAMTAEDRAALLNQLLAKEVSSFQEIPWETEPADVAQNLELAVARSGWRAPPPGSSLSRAQLAATSSGPASACPSYSAAMRCARC